MKPASGLMDRHGGDEFGKMISLPILFLHLGEGIKL
jgi:hypothetical protein